MRVRRDHAWAAGLGVVLAVAMTWPLALHLGSDFSQESYDTPFQTWQLAWIGHAILHSPLHLLDANIYWPDKHSLAFSDMLLGYAPAALVAAHGPQAALAVHNLLVLFANALAFLGAYLLARELGAGRWGGVAAGAAFAYAPWRLAQTGHLHVISSGGIPLALYFLLRGYRRRESRMVLAGWLVAAWQMTLGFTLGLQFAYLLPVLAVIAGIVRLQRGRARPPRGVIQVSAIGIAVFAVVTALVAQPYLRVLHEHPESKKTAAEVAFYSPPARAFLVAPSISYVWSGPTADRRATLRFPGEQTLFPGVTIVLLALLGLGSVAYSSGLRLGLATGTIICASLSLGLPSYAHPDQGFTPYRLLYDLAPGWDGVRTPGRINMLTSLGLALLAGAGLTLVLRYVRRRTRDDVVVALAAAVAIVAVLLEGLDPLPHPAAPAVPAGEAAAPAPQLHLPTGYADPLYAYWSIDGFRRIVNGVGSFNPSLYTRIVSAATTFPDSASVAFLRGLGVRSVVVHRDLAFGTPWQNAADRPIRDLGITRGDVGDLAVYDLRPGAARARERSDHRSTGSLVPNIRDGSTH